MSNQDLTIKQGTSFEWVILVTDVNDYPLNMVDYVGGTAGAKGHIKKNFSDRTPIAEFDVTITDSTSLEVLVANKELHLTIAQLSSLQNVLSFGKCYLLVRLSSSVSSSLDRGAYVYDIDVEDTLGFVFKPFSGILNIDPEVTHV